MTTRTSSRISKAPVRFEDECFKPGANNKHTVGRAVDAGHGVCQVDGSEHRMSATEAAELRRVEMQELYEECRTPAADAWNDARLGGDEDAMDGFDEWLCLQEKDDTWGDKEEPMTKVLSSQEKSELELRSRVKKENDLRFRKDLCDRGMCADNCALCLEEGGGAATADEPDVEEEEWVPDSDEDEEDEEDWLDTTDKLYWGEITPLPASVRWFSLKNGIWSRCCYAKKIGEDRWLVAPLDWLEECPEKIVDESEWLDNSIGVLTNTELHDNRYVVGHFEEAFGRKAEPSRWMAMPDDE